MTTNTRIDPSQLFNDSQLSLLIPQLCSSNSAPPRSTPSSSPSQTSIDHWIHSLLSSPTRTTSYYDESIEFYLVLSFSPKPELNHSQALSFLLQSLPEPHLTLAATVSYYEDTSNHPGEQQSNNVSALNPSNKLTSTHNITRETFHVITQPFNEEEGEVWVGKGVERNEWVGVWKFNCPISPIRSQELRNPKLAINVTVTFRDDPKLDRLLSSSLPLNDSKADNEEVGEKEEVGNEEEDEEYMDDSYDDVNLLSSLSSSSTPFHLPFSRLPLSDPSHARRHSRNRSLNANSLPFQEPLLRRSIQTTLDVKRALEVGLRTVRCSVPDLEKQNQDGEEGEGMVVCLEVGGPTSQSQEEEGMFEIESIGVRVNGIGAKEGGGSDVDVREIAGLREGEKMRLKGGVDQHNFLYSLSLSSSTLLQQQSTSPLTQTSTIDGGGVGGKESSLPIAVATSPSQRFTARFGAGDENETGEGFEEYEMERRREREREREMRRREEKFKRNLEVVVRGRVLVKRKKEKDTGGYRVDEGEQEQEVEEGEWISPTKNIESKWNYVIDISSFAYRPPPLQAYFLPPAASTSNSQPFLRPTSIAVPPIPLLPPQSTTRPISTQTERIEVESIAGSKRHTMASLASLSLKSPVLNRRSSFAPPLPSTASPYRPPVQRNPSNRGPSQSGSTANTPRRFFSLPPNGQSEEPSSISSSSNFLSNSTRTETPPPMIAKQSSPATARNSLPLPPNPNGQNGEPRRTSWMSGLGIGRPSAVAEEGRTSWDRRGSTTGTENGLGLGLDGGSSSSASNNPLPPLPPRPSEIDNQEQYQYYHQTDTGRVLITVSLVPLRQVKSRRRLLESTLTNGGGVEGGDTSNLPPPVLPGALSPPATHHASFSFPPSSSPNSPSPLASPNLNDTPEQFSEAERTAALTSRMPRVGLLDVFLVQLFVVNQTDQIKRFVVGVPGVKASESVGEEREGRLGGSARPGAKPEMSSREKDRVATLIPLENDVRIGPLAPNTCASLGLRMLAISPGPHVLEELKIVDLSDGSETRLKRPLWVVVE
ncbi:hypothetical protein JCM5353_001524 [Sporobolomyces roseus]